MATSLYDKNYARAVSDIFLERMSMQGKTIENVAQATNTKYHTLFRYLNGTRQMPIDLFQHICDYLDLDFVDTFQLVNTIATETTIKEYELIYNVKDILKDDD